MRSSFFESADITQFHANEAYSNSEITSDWYNINKKPQIEKEQVIFRIMPNILTD